VIFFHDYRNLFWEIISCFRCFQQLFYLNVATQRCRWRDNWSTRGLSFLVLSYKGMVLSICNTILYLFKESQKGINNGLHPKKIGSVLFLNALNPTHVPLSSANSRTLGTFCSSRMRWVDIEVPNDSVDMSSWESSACYP